MAGGWSINLSYGNGIGKNRNEQNQFNDITIPGSVDLNVMIRLMKYIWNQNKETRLGVLKI